jgi:hypothetical protein
MPDKLPSPNDILGSNKPTSSKLPSPSEVLGSSKKKVATVSPSTSDDGVSSSGTQPKKDQQQSASVSGKGKTDGVYYNPVNPEPLYKKEGGQWLIDINRSGKYVPLSKGDVQQRVNNLEKNAQKFTPKESGFKAPEGMNKADVVSTSTEWQKQPEKQQKQVKPTAQQVNAQESFEKDFSVYLKDDPIVKERERVKAISNTLSDVVHLEEEQVVPFLRDKIKETPEYDIFDFEEWGVGDKLKVTNKLTGQDIVIDLDNWSDDDANNERELLKAFIDVNLEFPEYNKYVQKRDQLATELNNPNAPNKWKIQQELEDVNGKILEQESLRRGYALSNPDGYRAAVVNQKRDAFERTADERLKNDVTALQSRASEVKKQAKEVDDYVQWLKNGVKTGAISKEDYQERMLNPNMIAAQEMVQMESDRIKADSKNVLEKADQNEVIAGLASIPMSKRGDAGSNAIAQFTKGFLGTVAFFHDMGKEEYERLMPAEKDQFYEAMSEVLPTEITEEYVQNPNLPRWEKALAGISESLGAALSTGPVGVGGQTVKSIGLSAAKGIAAREGYRKAAVEVTKSLLKKNLTPDQVGLFANAYSNFKDQMEIDPAFEEVSDADKVTMAAIYGVVAGKLERYGLTKSLSKSPIGKNLNAYILKNVFSKLPKDADTKMVNEAIEGSIRGLIARGVLNTGSASIIEGSTEAAQEIADITLKSAYNEIKGKEYFDTPKTIADAYDQVSESFKVGMIGGAMMNGTTQILNTPRDIRSASQIKTLENLAKSPEAKDVFVNNLKAKVINKEITPQQAQDQISELNESQAIIEKIPASVENKQESFGLLSQKQQLEEEIKGKDPSLVVVQKEKVAAIDQRLQEISIETESKTNKDVVQVEPDPQTGTEISEEIAPEPEPEVAAEEIIGQQAEEEVVDEIESDIEEIKTLDVTDKTKLQRVQSFVNSIDSALDRYGKETLGMNLPVAIAKPVVKTIKALVDAGVSLEQAIIQAAAKHKVNQSDIEDTIKTLQQQAVKQRLKEAEAISKPKKVSDAAKAAKTISKPSKKMIVTDEVAALKDQIRLEAKAAMGKKKQTKEVLSTISQSVKDMQVKGKISTRQMSSILSALKNVNTDSPKMIDRFIDYTGKIMTDADYAQKQSDASTARRQVKKLLKGKANPFSAVAKGFGELNPKLVDSIDEYNEIAGKIKSSLRPSSVRQGEVKFKEESDLKEVAAYVAKEQKAQMEIHAENIRSAYEQITGESAGDKSIPDLKAEMMEGAEKEDFTDQIKEVLRDKLDELKEEIPSGAPKEIQAAVKINVDIIDAKTALRIIDAIDSYLVNGTTAGLRAQMAAYKGIENAKKSELNSRSIRLLLSKKAGRLYGEQLNNLNVLTERIFRGVNAAAKFRKESGVQEIINGANKAETDAKVKQNEYLKKFTKRKNFDSAENIFERGALAFLKRNTENIENQEAEFERRKELLKQSVEALKKGSEVERKKAEFYEKALNKIGVYNEGTTIKSIESKASKDNVEAVQHITDMWSELYPDISEFAIGVHNTLLPSDVNYTPDRFSLTEGENKDIEQALSDDSFGFSNFNNLVLDKNEAGVLIESKKPKKLPKGRYVDLDFDSNMFRSYKLALTDMNTAEPIRQADKYLRSPEFQEMIVTEDRKILENAVSDYVRSKKGGNFDDSGTLQYLQKLTNAIGSLGAARALAGFGQFVNQFSTQTMNTFVNAGSSMNFRDMFNKKVHDLIDKSGRAISNRGLESVTTLNKIDDGIKKANVLTKTASVPLEKLADWNAFMLKWLLQKPDVIAARLAWAAYYRQSLKKQGLPIEFDSNNINDEAADYAQAMVDRNADVSDTDMRGKFFRNKHAVIQFVKQVFFPFSTFSINQRNRLWNDLSVASSKLSSREDKIIASRSIAAFVAEQALYNGIRYAIGRLILEAAMESLDLDDEEQKEMVEQSKKYIIESTGAKMVTDVFSPNPLLDNMTLKAMNLLFSSTGVGGASEGEFKAYIDEINKKRFENYEDPLTEEQIDKKRTQFFKEGEFQFFVNDEQSYGQLGIQGAKGVETYEMGKAWKTGAYTQESDYGDHEKFLTKEGQDKLMLPFMLKLASSTLAPREAGQLADRMYKIVKKKYGLTDSQSGKVKALEEQGYKITDDALEIIKAKSGWPKTVDGIAEELDYISTLDAKEKKAYLAEKGL